MASHGLVGISSYLRVEYEGEQFGIIHLLVKKKTPTPPPPLGVMQLRQQSHPSMLPSPLKRLSWRSLVLSPGVHQCVRVFTGG